MTEAERIANDIVAAWKQEPADYRGLDPLREAIAAAITSAGEAIPVSPVTEEEVAVAHDQGCRIPPQGWWCSREPGHDGPCAARRSVVNDDTYLLQMWRSVSGPHAGLTGPLIRFAALVTQHALELERLSASRATSAPQEGSK